MNKTDYAKYLQSEHWLEVRSRLLGDGPEWCVRCDMPRWLARIAYDQDLHIHHKHYRTLGSEAPDDLEILCRRCHEIETFGKSILREIQRFICAGCERAHWDTGSRYCPVCTSFALADSRANIGPSMFVDIHGHLGWQYLLTWLYQEGSDAGTLKEFYRFWETRNKKSTREAEDLQEIPL